MSKGWDVVCSKSKVYLLRLRILVQGTHPATRERKKQGGGFLLLKKRRGKSLEVEGPWVHNHDIAHLHRAMDGFEKRKKRTKRKTR